MRLHIYILSYNRGEFLRNSVDSVGRHAPDARVTIIDDLSDDSITKQTLETLRVRFRILQPSAVGKGRHGGLYINMQRALDESAPDEVLLFLQDDVQLVRDLTAEDLAYIERFFSHHPSAAFLHPCFLKGERGRRDRRITRLAEGFSVYFRAYPQKHNKRGISYADVVLAHAGRLQSAAWKFAPSEIDNAASAALRFGMMGFMAHPFAMFLPEVPVSRHKHRTWGMRLVERRTGRRPKAYEPMPAAEVQALKERALTELPVAERFLRCADDDVRRPFTYHVINRFPMLRALDKLETAWRRFIGWGQQ